MLLYTDIVTGDRMLSDAFPIKTIDGVAWEVDGETDQAGDGASWVSDFVRDFRLSPATFDKKRYLTQLRGYMGAVKRALAESGATEDEIAAFEKGVSAYAKKITANFAHYEFWTGESNHPDGMVVLLAYRDDDTPYFTFWQHGLQQHEN
ncbi:translationally-controlled tumor protein [Streptomyces sp. NPDC052309]|uniref:translationally-controlled tumor protein n=1 Tax=Streptomyces sp. NPDC052309 TaxID=3155421 RepID=UPI003415D844